MRKRRKPIVLAAALVALAIVACPPSASAAPSCEEGPETVGNTIVGTPCDDTIRPPRSVTQVFGEGGNDTLYGGRGNDRLFGGGGNDRLYGGIGDDQLRGGADDDWLSGGFGADSALDGEAGNDFVRGDATIDAIQNSGGGTDTLSYATGVTPGFFNRSGFPDFSLYENFPQTVDGRGAYVNLGTGKGDNGRAPHGGGYDESVEGASFEVVIGTAFPDYIVGTDQSQTIYGGGGADVLIGGGGGDTVYGGAEGDSCDAAVTVECESSEEEVAPRDAGAIAVGAMAPQAGGPAGLYLTGSDEDDEVTATYAAGAVTFTLGPGSEGEFDTDPASAGGCGAPAAGTVVCAVSAPPDSVLLAGLLGADILVAAGFPETTSVIALGGAGGDEIDGGGTEDALVDGDGPDLVRAAGGDDAVPNNEGDDDLNAGPGEDLFVSDSICEGDSLDGGADRDNANWANFDFAIAIDMAANAAGLVGSGGAPECASGTLTSLQGLEDIEGTSLADTLVGDPGPNQILGRLGADTYFAAAGDDSILANSGTPIDDPDPTIDCGEGFDTAQIDRPQNGPDAAPSGCESVEERDPNSFRPPDTPLDPDPPVEPEAETSTAQTPPQPPAPPPPAIDRKAPRTSIVRRPAARLFLSHGNRRRIALSFSSSESPARFLCKLDRKRFARCRSPRVYWLLPGRHVISVAAVDLAGNRDRTPARIAFQVLRAG
jgi:Ca2+-binding RTX toxin-like protein